MNSFRIISWIIRSYVAWIQAACCFCFLQHGNPQASLESPAQALPLTLKISALPVSQIPQIPHKCNKHYKGRMIISHPIYKKMAQQLRHPNPGSAQRNCMRRVRNPGQGIRFAAVRDGNKHVSVGHLARHGRGAKTTR